MKPINCKSCTKLLLYASVFVGEIKCGRCNYKTEYRILTQSFIKAVQEGEAFVRDEPAIDSIAVA